MYVGWFDLAGRSVASAIRERCSMRQHSSLGIRRKSIATALALAVSGFLSVTPAAHAASTTIFVSPTGNDQAAGTAAAPLGSLAEAQRRARAALTSGDTPVRVLLQDGTYPLSETLEFGAADSGTAAAPVVWEAAPDAHPVIAGGRTLHPSWTTYQGQILVADIGSGLDADQLFANGQRQIMARYPNFQAGQRLDGYAADAISAQRAAGWANPTTGFVRALHQSEWGGNDYRITGIGTNGVPTLAWVGDNQRGSGPHATYRMVENIFEELDSAGEWFYDKPSGKLYYWPAQGVDPATATFATAELNELIRVVGTDSANPVHDITFSGITFTRTHRTLFNSTFEPISLSDWAIVRKGSVYLKNTRGITVADSTFDQVGGNAVFIDGYGSKNVVDNNVFTGSGASDVAIVGSESAARQASTWGHEVRTMTDNAPGPKTEDYPRDITVSNNLMTHMGRFEKQTSGIEISRAFKVTATHNTIHDGPRAGINIGDGTWGGHVLDHNDIWNMVQETGDHGPINSWGRDRFWPINGSTDAERKARSQLDHIEPTIIENNRIWHNSEWAIDLDDGSSNYILRNNLLLNAGTKFREGFNRSSLNNIYVNGAAHSHVSYAANGDQVKNNIFLDATPYRFIQADPTPAGITYDNNVFFNNGNAVNFSDYGANLAAWQANKSQDLHSVVANPAFVGPTPWAQPAKLDYTVAAGSPALTAGFVNFPMNEFGRPGETAVPPPVAFSTAPAVATRESQPEPWLGATTTGIYSDTLASSVGLAGNNGLYLQTVPANSAASAAGLRASDVILTIKGTDVTDKNSFWRVWNVLPADEKVALKVWRNQAAVDLTLTRPGGVEKINNTSGMVYTGPGWDWKTAGRGGAGSYLDDLDASDKSGASFSFTFQGTRLVMYTQTNSDETAFQISIDGGPAQTVDLATAGRVYQAKVFDSGPLPAKVHTVTAVSNQNKYFLVDAFEITHAPMDDVDAPVTTATTVPAAPNTAGWFDRPVTVSLAAADAGTVASTEYSLDGSDWAAYTQAVPISGNGSHTLKYRSTDGAGNVEETKSIDFKVDDVDPVTAATTSGDNPVTVTLTAADATSGIAATRYRIGSGEWQDYTAGFQVPRTAAAATVTFRSTDVAGNTEPDRTLVLPGTAGPERAPSTTALVIGTPTVPVGSALSLVVTTTSTPPVGSGLIAIRSGDDLVAAGRLVDGRATIALNLPVGNYRLSAEFAGNAAVAPSTSTEVGVSVSFTDYRAGQFFDEVQWAATTGVIAGYLDGTFRPAQSISREAVAAVLYRAAHPGADLPTCTGTAPFPDVSVKSPFCGAISWLVAEGITAGFDDGRFRPSATVDRQATAAFFYRWAHPGRPLPVCTGTKPFGDVPLTNQFCGAISWLVAQGITSGWTDGTFRPTAQVERQAFAAFLYRYQHPTVD